MSSLRLKKVTPIMLLSEWSCCNAYKLTAVKQYTTTIVTGFIEEKKKFAVLVVISCLCCIKH